jgi:valyl-tRNA synthetase
MEKYELGIAVSKIYDFIWNEFCNWYIEMTKVRLYDKDCATRKSAQYTLNKVLCDSLKLLHPVMPFVTEKIYTELYNDDESIMISKWPEYSEKYNFANEEDEIEKFKTIITEIRNIRNNMNVHPSRKSKLLVVTENHKDLITESEELLKKLGFAEEVVLKADKSDIPSNAVSVVTDGIEVFMPFEDLVDIAAEKERLEGEKTKLEAEVMRAEKMLSNPGFVNKAPEAKINEEKAKLAKYKEMLDSVIERLSNM